MKILFLTHQLHTNGGTEIYLRRLLTGLAGRGIQSWCVSGGEPVAGPFRHVIDPRLSDFPWLSGARAAGADLLALHKRECFDAIHVSNIFNPHLVGLFSQHPRALRHVHDHRLFCPRGTRHFADTGAACREHAGLICFVNCLLLGRNSRTWSLLYPDYLRNQARSRSYARVLVASRYMADELVAVGFDAARITVLPYFVPRREPAPLPLPPGPLRVLFVGRMVDVKGADLLLSALAKVPGVMATFVGDGPQLPALRHRAALPGLSGRVQFTGDKENAAIAGELERSHLLVMPSLWPEPFGIVGIEAMSAGRAVIATDQGGVSDWLIRGETGVLVPPNDAVALAGALSALAGDFPAVERMGHAGWERAASFLEVDHLDKFIKIAETVEEAR